MASDFSKTAISIKGQKTGIYMLMNTVVSNISSAHHSTKCSMTKICSKTTLLE